MLRRFAFGLLFAGLAYPAAAALAYFLIDALSSNANDRPLEAAMTSAFVFGPLGAVLGFIGGCVFGGRRSDP